MIRLAVIDKQIKQSSYSIHRLEDCGKIKYVESSEYKQKTIESMGQDEQMVVVFNVSLIGEGGEALLKQIENREARVCLYLSTDQNTNTRCVAQNGILASADFILLNSKVKNTLVDEMDSVFNQGNRINPKITSRILQFISHPQLKHWEALQKLSNREIEIMNLVADGFQYKEIALRLNISFQTVKSHLKNIFAKLGVNSRVEATLKYTSKRIEMPNSLSKIDI